MAEPSDVPPRQKAHATLAWLCDRLQLPHLQMDGQLVELLDRFIEDARTDDPPTDDERATVAGMLGCLLGECLIAELGGHWSVVDGQWAVTIDDDFHVFPIPKVAKQFENGEADSVLALLEVLPILKANRGQLTT